MTVAEWYRSAPPGIAAWMDGVVFRNFVRDEHAASFRMIGVYDGAMSEECKRMFREQYEAIGALRIAMAPPGATA